MKFITSFLLIASCLLHTVASAQDDCPALTIKDFPTTDLPPEGFQPAADMTSSNYYYGIGVPSNFDTARYYAFKELAAGNESPIDGAAVLLMLYANGFGVARDLELSLKLACGNIVGAPAEMEGREQHLNNMKTSTGEPFDICDGITSGYMMGFCASIMYDKKEQERNIAVAELLQNWPAKDTAAYNKLGIAAGEFFNKRVDGEVDASGTARAAMVLGEYDALEEGFAEKTAKADRCSFIPYSAADFAKADAELNTVYKKLMATNNFEYGTVKLDDIKLAQRSWITYRDAWVTFGKTRCPQLPAEAWKTMLTLERTEQLKEFIDE